MDYRTRQNWLMWGLVALVILGGLAAVAPPWWNAINIQMPTFKLPALPAGNLYAKIPVKADLPLSAQAATPDGYINVTFPLETERPSPAYVSAAYLDQFNEPLRTDQQTIAQPLPSATAQTFRFGPIPSGTIRIRIELSFIPQPPARGTLPHLLPVRRSPGPAPR